VEIDGAGARLVPRNRNRFKHLDSLAAALAKRLRVKDAILDGEIICAEDTGRPIFIEMLRGRHPFSFVAFDLWWLNGEDLRALALVSGRRGSSGRCVGVLITSLPRRWRLRDAGARSWRPSRSMTLRASPRSGKPIRTGVA
jgi:hypothetical protein